MARPAWTLLRSWIALLSFALGALALLAPSRLRRRGMRALGQTLGKLEQILRSLLVLMRAPAAPAKGLPFTPRPGSNAPRRRRCRPHFSLTLQKFSWAPVALTPPGSAHGTSGTVTAERLDPAAALKRRFDALHAVMAEPASHAARITALLAAHGLRQRAPKPLIPAAIAWTLEHVHAPVQALAHAPAHPDTS